MPGSGNDGNDPFTKSLLRSHTEAPFAFAEKFSLVSPWPSIRDKGGRYLLECLLALKPL